MELPAKRRAVLAPVYAKPGRATCSGLKSTVSLNTSLKPSPTITKISESASAVAGRAIRKWRLSSRIPWAVLTYRAIALCFALNAI